MIPSFRCEEFLFFEEHKVGNRVFHGKHRIYQHIIVGEIFVIQWKIIS